MRKLLMIICMACGLMACLSAFAANPYFEENHSNDIDHEMNAPLNQTFQDMWETLRDSPKSAYLDSQADFEAELFALINEYREENGLTALIWNDNVAYIARLRSLGCLAYAPMTSHDIKKLGGTMKGTMKKCGIDYSGIHVENFAQSGSTKPKAIPAEKIFQQWKDSPGHNKNLLNQDVRYGGIGAVYSGNVMDKKLYGVMATFCAVK